MKRGIKRSWTIVFNAVLMFGFIVMASLVIMSLPEDAYAGSLDSPGSPASGSGMPTLKEIYDRLDTGADISAPGAFQEPVAGPTAGTGRNLAGIKDKLPSPDNTNGASTADVLSGKTFWGLRTDGAWGLKTGTLSSQPNVTGANGQLTFSIPDGYYSGRTATAADSNLASANIKSGITIFGVSGDINVVNTSGATATPSDILSGKTAYVNGSLIMGNVATRGNVTGGNGQRTFSIPDGYYSGRTATAADSNLASANIKSGVTIFGVAGSHGAYTCSTGDLSPQRRWCDNHNGTVRDMTTGLIWLKNAGWGGAYPFWVNTISGTNAHDRAAQAKDGVAGLTDGSQEGDWRLPTKSELAGLASGTEAIRDTAQYKFIGVQSAFYWSSTTYASDTDDTWSVHMWNRQVYLVYKGFSNYVWPVRSGTP